MKLPFIVLSILFIFSTNAYCQDDDRHISSEKMNYMNVHGGAAFYNKFDALDYDNKKPKNSGVFGVGVGRHLNQYIAAEANLTRFHDIIFKHNVFPNDPSNAANLTQKFSVTNFGLNLKAISPQIAYGVKPFLNIGMGYALNETGNVTQITSTDTTQNDGRTFGQLSYNLGAGISFPIIDAINGSIAYQYYDLGKSKSSSVSSLNGVPTSYSRPFETKIKANSVLATIQYNY